MKQSYLFTLIFISLSLFTIPLALLLTNCSPIGTDERATNNNGDTSSPIKQTEAQCEKEKDDDTEICAKQGEDCTSACKTLYRDPEEISKCTKLTAQQVSFITNIHIILTSGNKSDLQKLSNTEEINNLGCYLSIGETGWLNWIKTDAETKQAQNTLEWLIENKKITRLITNNPNSGKEIIKNLLLKALPHNIGIPDKALSTATIGTFTGNSDTKDLWRIKYNTLEIFTINPAVPEKIIFTSNEALNLYVSLSHFTLNKVNDNIISYSVSENNSNFFAVIFDILSEVCNLAGNNNNEAIACKKALLCWTNQRNENTWNIIEGNNNHKEILGGEENYKDCTAGAFSQLF